MTTRYTAALARQLSALGRDPGNFSAEFDAWKSSGQAGEYQSYLFGKDGSYLTPLVGGVRYILRHVHLAPLQDADAMRMWDLNWRRRTRKTSDRALVYVSDERHGSLLIFILDEPDAHEIARMRTAPHQATMKGMAKVAERFLFDGGIIG